MNNAFRDGEIRTNGTEFDSILPPMSRFGGGSRDEQKERIIDELKAFFDEYYGLIDPLSDSENESSR